MPLELVVTMLMLCANNGRAQSLQGKWSYHWEEGGEGREARDQPHISRCVRISKRAAQKLARLDYEPDGEALRCDEDESGYRIFATQAACVADRAHMVALPL
jgi:hypothetical protein